MAREHFYDALFAVYRAHGTPTLASLARRSGISKGQLSRIINGRVAWPTETTIIKILRALDATGDETVSVLSVHEEHTPLHMIAHTDQASLIVEIRLLRESIDRLTRVLNGQAVSVPDQ